jgi:hypothetical protein
MANTVNITNTKNTVTITPQSNTLTTSTTSNSVSVTQGSTSVVTVNTPGPRGQIGPQGLSSEQNFNLLTGSLLVTASYSSPTLTFTKGDGNQFSLEIESAAQRFADSITNAAISDGHITFTKGDSTTINIEVNNVTSSLSASFISDSFISASAVRSGFGSSDFNFLINVPSGLISSSNQILPIATSSITNFDTEVSRSAAEAGFGTSNDGIGGLFKSTGSFQSTTSNLQITGSLNITGSITASGDITASSFNGVLIQSTENGGFIKIDDDTENLSVSIGHYETNVQRNISIGEIESQQVDAVQIGGRRVGGGLGSISIGDSAQHSHTTAYSIGIGFNANRFSNGDIGIGKATLYNDGGTFNSAGTTAIGHSAGYTQDGINNVILGNSAGYQSIGKNSVYLGHSAGYTASGSGLVLLGYQAGYNLTGSNQLIIANTGSKHLIRGNFEAETVEITGSLDIKGSITASGNISASGTIVGSNLSGTNTGDQDLSNLITATQTSSFVQNSATSSFITATQTSSFVQNSATSSFITATQTSSFVVSADTASFAITGSDVLFNHITASGNVDVEGTLSIPGFSNVSSSLAAAVAGGDNLGNHTATQDLNLNSNSIKNIANITASGNISASGDIIGTNIIALTAATSSYLTSTPDGTISGSTQIASDISGAFVAPSSSFSTRVTTLETNNTGTNTGDQDLSGLALKTAISGAFVAPSSSFSTRITTLEGGSGLTPGTISGSAQIASEISGSWQGQNFISGSQVIENLPNGLYSSSLQILTSITASGNISSSNNLIGNSLVLSGGTFTSSSLAAAISDSGVSDYTQLTNVPSGIISSSLQIFTSITASGNISASGEITASAFKGDGSGLNNVTSTPPAGTYSSSLQILTSITASGNISSSGNIIGKSGSFDHIEIDSFVNSGTGAPTISSATNLTLSASGAVVIRDLIQLNGTDTGSIAGPINGSIIYDSLQHKFFGYANGNWVAFN